MTVSQFSSVSLEADVDGGGVGLKATGCVGDGAANDSAGFARVLATKRRVQVEPGTYKVAPFTLNAGQHIEGESSVFSPHSNATLLCDTSAGTPGVFMRLRSINKVSSLRVIGSSLAAGWTGMRLSENNEYGFTAANELDRVHIGNFDLGLDVNNAFLCRYKDVTVADCNYGARFLPSTDGTNGGYYTTQIIDRLSAETCAYWGLYMAPPGTSYTFDIGLLDIERNCTNPAALYQGYMENCHGVIRTLYGEGSYPKPLLQLKNCNLTVLSGMLTSTGGFHMGTDANTLTLIDMTTTGPSDLVKGEGGSNQKVHFIRCNWWAAPQLAAGTRVIIEDSTVGGVTYTGRHESYWDGTGFIGQPIKDVRSWNKVVSGTVPANGTLVLLANQAITYGWEKGAVGWASFSNVYAPDITLIVTIGSAGSQTQMSVIARNHSASAVTLTSADLNICMQRPRSFTQL